MLFGGRGESGSDRLAKAQKAHAVTHRAAEGLFRGGGAQRAAGEPTGSGGIPSVFLPTAAQERRKAAGEAAGAGRSPSILPRSEAHIRREAIAKARAQEEAAAIIRRAAETKARQEVEARAQEQARKAVEARRAEEARRAAEAVQVRRAAYERDLRRVLVVKANIPNAALSAIARAVFAHLVVKFTDNGDRPVIFPADAVAFALRVEEAEAREALNGLQRLGWVVSVTDAFGAKKLMPAAHAAATVEVEAE